MLTLELSDATLFDNYMLISVHFWNWFLLALLRFRLRPPPTLNSKMKQDEVPQQDLKVKSFCQLKWQTLRLTFLFYFLNN